MHVSHETYGPIQLFLVIFFMKDLFELTVLCYCVSFWGQINTSNSSFK